MNGTHMRDLSLLYVYTRTVANMYQSFHLPSAAKEYIYSTAAWQEFFFLRLLQSCKKNFSGFLFFCSALLLPLMEESGLLTHATSCDEKKKCKIHLTLAKSTFVDFLCNCTSYIPVRTYVFATFETWELPQRQLVIGGHTFLRELGQQLQSGGLVCTTPRTTRIDKKVRLVIIFDCSPLTNYSQMNTTTIRWRV